MLFFRVFFPFVFVCLRPDDALSALSDEDDGSELSALTFGSVDELEEALSDLSDMGGPLASVPKDEGAGGGGATRNSQTRVPSPPIESVVEMAASAAIKLKQKDREDAVATALPLKPDIAQQQEDELVDAAATSGSAPVVEPTTAEPAAGVSASGSGSAAAAELDRLEVAMEAAMEDEDYDLLDELSAKKMKLLQNAPAKHPATASAAATEAAVVDRESSVEVGAATKIQSRQRGRASRKQLQNLALSS